MKKIILALAFFYILVPDTFAQTGQTALLNTRSYSEIFGFRNGNINIINRYVVSVSDDDHNRYGGLGGEYLDTVDTPLEFALLSYYSYSPAVVQIRPDEANAMLPADNPRLADQKLGAAVFQEIQILRFLGDTAAVNRHEAMLQYITGRGNVTRAEVETYYRNGIRGLISEVVDEEFNYRWLLMSVPPDNLVTIVYLSRNPQNGHYTLSFSDPRRNGISASSLEALTSVMSNIPAEFNQVSIDDIRNAKFPSATVPAITVTHVKDSLTNFFTTPNQTNFNVLKNVFAAASDAQQDAFDTGLNPNDQAWLISDFLAGGLIDRNRANILQNNLNEQIRRRRVLNIPNDANIDWNDFWSAYGRILNNLNTELVRRMR